MKSLLKAYVALQQIEILSAEELKQKANAARASRSARGNITAQKPNGIRTYKAAQKAEKKFLDQYAV